MTAEQIRLVRNAQPFIPVAIVLVDGRRFQVTYRDYISVAPFGNVMVCYNSNCTANILNSSLIAELALEAHPADAEPRE